MIECPQCNNKATRLPGTSYGISHAIAYYKCSDCDIKFSVTGNVVKMMNDEPELTFRTRRQAFGAVRQAMKDDREWFGANTEETIELARSVVQLYFFRKDKPRKHKRDFVLGNRFKRQAA